MSNILEWLSPQHGTFMSHQVQAGAPYPIELDGTTTEVSVRKPSGEWLKLPVTENPLAFRDTSEVGIYTREGRQENATLCCQLGESGRIRHHPETDGAQDRLARRRECIDAGDG